MRKNYFVYLMFYCALACILTSCSNEKKQVKTQEKYEWKNVSIVGGGFVDGYLFHPAEKDLMYARTDMGGAYRRDVQSKKWVPLTDWVSYEDRNLMGIESMAIDPTDANKLYLACGTYTNDTTPNGEILISNDRGNSFARVKMPFKMGGNENGRGHGERLMVDPNEPNILYLGTRMDGLWKSSDGAKTWAKVESFPDVSQAMPDSVVNASKDFKGFWNWAYRTPGITMIRFDAKSATTGNASSIIYAFVGLTDRYNVYRSTDSGSTWQPIEGQPQNIMPTDAELSADGYLYITYGDAAGPWIMRDGAVWKYNTKNGQWTDISPEKQTDDGVKKLGYGFASIELDPQDTNVVIACSFQRPWQRGGEEIFRSLDGGKTWIGAIAKNGKYDFSKAPYIAHTGIHWLFDFEINPFDSNHAIFTCGYGGHETYNLQSAEKGDSVVWEVCSTGIEETVPLDLLSPTQGPHLISGIGDYGGFFHWDLDKPNAEGNYTNPHFGNTDGLALAENDPNMVVRVGVASHQRPQDANIGYTLDMGKTWQSTKATPFSGCKHGHIAVSTDGKNWIWTPEKAKPYLTTDRGDTWTEITSLPINTRIVADKVNNLRFYGLNTAEGLYYESVDGGKTFKTIKTGIEMKTKPGKRGDERGGQDRIYSTPGIENELWVASFDGLFVKNGDDDNFVQTTGVQEIHGFGFGKAAPDAEYPALFIIGIVNGVRGVFRSDDKAQNWIRINDEQHQWGLLLHITGDPKKYGRVYIGTHGRGIIYGDPIDVL